MTTIPGLIPLHTGQPGLRCSFSVKVHQPGPAKASPSPGGEGRGEGGISGHVADAAILDFISSDATVDRYGEIISPAGWHLATYRQNPVFQNSHQYGNILFTLGRALITEVRPSPPPHSLSSSGGEGRGEEASDLSTRNPQPSTYLFQRIQFAVDANPIAKIAYALYSGGFLHAVSVGFIPLRWQDSPSPSSSSSFSSSSSIPPPERSEAGPAAPEPSEGESTFPTPHSALRTPHSQHGPRRIYLEQELLEVSAVAIPANPNALALALKSGAVEKSDLKDTADLINYMLDSVHAPLSRQSEATADLSRQSEAAAERSTLHAPHAPPADLAPLLALLRSIRAQLKHL